LPDRIFAVPPRRSSTNGPPRRTASSISSHHILIHEVGHHFGLSDEDMHALEEKRGVSRLLRFEG
jgi:hypothetical protein